MSDKWKTFARVSRFQTDQVQPDYTGGADQFKMRLAQGSKRNGWNIAADTVYTMNSSTAVNLRAAYYQVEDKRDYPEMAVQPEDYQSLWQNQWYQPYMDGRPILYFPFINMGNYGNYGVDSAWWQIPEGYSLHARFNKYLQRHSLKAGSEVRIKRGEAARFRYFNFFVNANATANTTASPNLNQVGHPWASFLLGALDTTGSGTSSSAQYVPMQISDTEMYGLYLQDDFRIRDNVTLNLGVRWEYEGGLFDPDYRLPREIDLTQPIPGMQAAIDPRIPADVKAIMAESAGQKSYLYNGAYYFTDEENPRNAKVSPMQFMPRIGLAWSLDRRTAVRLGYGRFYTPQMLVNENATMGQLDLGAFSPTTPMLPDVQGVPQATLSNPFPQGLTPAYGKRYGTNTGLGDNVRWDEYRQRPAISDRFSFSVQREIMGAHGPGRVVSDELRQPRWLPEEHQHDGSAPQLQVRRGAAGGSAEPVLPVRHRRYVPRRAAIETDRVACRSAAAVSAVPEHVPGLDERPQGSIPHRRAPRAAVGVLPACRCSPATRTCAARARSSTTTSTNTTASGRGPTCRIRGIV